jgi:hypothetical protein
MKPALTLPYPIAGNAEASSVLFESESDMEPFKPSIGACPSVSWWSMSGSSSMAYSYSTPTGAAT